MRDAQDIEHAIDRFGDAVWRACLTYVPAHDAEDAFQNTFAKYARHDAAFNGEEHAKAWLLRVAINDCKDMLRSRARSHASLDAEIDRWGDAFAPAANDCASEVREVLDAVDRLSDPPKTPLYLFACEGYSVPEIARMMEVPEGTVYSWISRGRKQLKEALS
ncbi:MAG: RNA polymerase sigma factor [Slackia sp.]|nr:RNA polymerase sigma factor [Slackia sp.]